MFDKLNQRQKVSVIMVLTAIALQTGEKCYFLGGGGCGKTEAIKFVLDKLQECISISTPTGNLAKG